VEPSRPEPSLASVDLTVAGSSAAFPVESALPVAPHAAPGIPSADLALYRRAHELHFDGADRARALAAWDGYLKAFPRGTFAPEARLNRAVCLARLGRTAEAEDALGEIERGRFGKHGRRQARKILSVLSD
jgi:TolA-binding protein